MGEVKTVKGFCYTPVAEGSNRRDHLPLPPLPQHDGKNWERIADGAEFSNIKNNPIPQYVTWDKPAEARYLKLEPLEEMNGQAKTSVAEFGVMLPE